MKLVLEETISQEPKKVFEVFTDLGRAAERVESITAIELLGQGPVGRGTAFRETRTMFGRSTTEQMEITEFEPHDTYAVEAQTCGCHFRTSYRFVPVEGGTQVTMTMVSQPLTTMAKIMGPLMGWMTKGAMVKAMKRDHADLKAVCESS